MAQDTKPAARPDTSAESENAAPGFHYYSGGEVKELSNTNVSPLLWGFWSVVIVGAIAYLLLGGALGPNSPFDKGYEAPEGKAAVLATVQQNLDKTAYGGGDNPHMADMTRLPLPAGESLTTAVDHGSNLYQTYCIGCHGPNQDGNGVNASALNPKPRNLHDAPFMRETMTPERINTSLHYGVHGTAMPRWENTLSTSEIQEVIAYVLSLTWDMPKAGMDTTTSQLATPSNRQPSSPAADKPGNSGPTAPTPGKSVGNSTTNSPGGSFVRGGSVSNSPEPITPAIDGNPAAATSTAPPSQSGQSAPIKPGSVDVNTPDSSSAPAAPASPSAPKAAAPGGGM